MSRYFLIGGFVGFGLIFFLSFWAGASIHVALRNGMIACLVLGLLVKFLFSQLGAAYVAAKLKELEALEKQRQAEESEGQS